MSQEDAVLDGGRHPVSRLLLVNFISSVLRAARIPRNLYRFAVPVHKNNSTRRLCPSIYPVVILISHGRGVRDRRGQASPML